MKAAKIQTKYKQISIFQKQSAFFALFGKRVIQVDTDFCFRINAEHLSICREELLLVCNKKSDRYKLNVSLLDSLFSKFISSPRYSPTETVPLVIRRFVLQELKEPSIFVLW